MAKTKTEYDLLISCPGDVTNEIKVISRAVKKFNDTYSDVLAIRLNVKHWSNSSYNQSGGKAQDLLNKQFIHDCDAAIAVFWTRFGTPTDNYDSGTEEEIEDMIKSGKQVFLYFSEKPVSPELLLSKEAKQQYQKVKDFQKRYEQDGKGLYSTYSTDKDFQEKVFAHVSQHFLSLKKIEEISALKKSNLNLNGINGAKLIDSAVIQNFRFDSNKTTEEMISEIKALYSLIDEMDITEKVLNQLGFAMYKKVELLEDTKKLISSFAEQLSIGISENFFSLGGLRESIINTSMIYGGRSFEGEQTEKEKYNKIIELKEKIETLLVWAPFEKSYGKLKCIKLAIKNGGTMYDEDIDIILKVKSELLIIPENLPQLDEYSYENIVKDYSMDELFGIIGTPYFNDFESSRKSFSSAPINNPTPTLPLGFMGSGRDYKEEFYEDLCNAFEYEFFSEGENTLVKLHVDYLKHNTAVAFPTVLFVSKDLSSIEYTITSKYNEAVVNGILKVGEQQ